MSEHRSGGVAATESAAIGRAAMVMAGATMLSRVTGLLRTVAFAGLGATALADAYTLANNSPNIVFELVVGGVLSATLVPVFVDLLRHGRDEAEEGISAVVTLAGLVAIAAAVALFVAAPWVIRLYDALTPRDTAAAKVLATNQRVLATELLRMFAPQVAVYGFITIGTALLNARRRFAAPMLAPVVNNLVVIVVMLWAQRMIHQLRVAAVATNNTGAKTLELVGKDTSTKLLLGLGTTAGVLAMGAALIPSLRDSGLRIRFRWQPRHPSVVAVIRLSGWTFGYVLANQVALNFVYAVAKRDEGGLTAYTAAYSTFFLLPHGIAAVSIMTALQPQLAQDFLDRARGRFRFHLNEGIRNTMCLLIPAAFLYIVLARPVVELTLRRGDMTIEKARLIADTVRAFVIGLPAFSVYLLLMNALKAMRNTRATFRINVWENAINIILAGLLYGRFGIQGMAFAFAIAYIVAAVYAGTVVGKATNRLGGYQIATSLRNIVSVSVIMSIAAWFTSALIRHSVGTHGLLFKLPNRPELLVEVGLSALVGVTVFLAVGRMVGIAELQVMLSGIRRRVDRRLQQHPPHHRGDRHEETPTMYRTRPSIAPRRSPITTRPRQKRGR